MSFYYNFFTRDISPYDDPGFFIRLNGQNIFTKRSSDVAGIFGDANSTGWNQFTYNLSLVTDSMTNLAFYAGNTGDKDNQSWVYLDKITTYFVTARGTADYNLAGTDSLSGVAYCEYKEGGGAWTTFVSPFQISTSGGHDLSYRCVDNAGNFGAISLVKVITDTDSPETISDLGVVASTYNSATLQWTAPGNDGVGSTTRSSSYDVRFSTSPITDEASFDAATVVENISAPKLVGETEILEVLGLNPSILYYFAVKTKDEAPNTSLLSNVPSVTTAVGSAVNPGDIVINELMWSGTSLSATDEWIELKNTTDRTLDLAGASITRLASGVEVTMIDAASFAGKSIDPHGYFLLSHFASTSSKIKDTVIPDIVDAGVDVSETELEIKLYSGSTLIDTAWDGTAASEGISDDINGKYYSMERTGVPGDGANSLNWYTCIDSASSTDYFDGGTDERGTPGAKNRSENEPLAHQLLLSRNIVQSATVSATMSAENVLSNEIVQSESIQSASVSAVKTTVTPTVALVRSQEGKNVSFTVKDISTFASLAYELTYDSSIGVQGAIGNMTLHGDSRYVKNDILLGTCSTGGTCVYHQDVKHLLVRVSLVKNDGTVVEIQGSEIL
jgi:CxxC motif-containing protein